MPDIVSDRPVAGAAIASSWGDEVHDALEGIQSGIATLPAAASPTSTLVVVFPRPYTAPPVVLMTPRDANGAAQVEAATSITATQFTAYQRHRSDANVLAAAFSWVAIGTVA